MSTEVEVTVRPRGGRWLDRTCEQCGERFQAEESTVRRGGGRFCRSCVARRNRSRGQQARRVERTCEYDPCPNTFQVTEAEIARGKAQRFCENSCRALWTRANHPERAGGRPPARRVERTCEYDPCPNTFQVTEAEIARGKAQRFCDPACAARWRQGHGGNGRPTAQWLERTCEYQLCTNTVRARELEALRGHGRFCCHAHKLESRIEEFIAAGHRFRAQQIAARADVGLLDTASTAQALGLTLPALQSQVRTGRLQPADRLDGPKILFFRTADVNARRREIARRVRSSDPHQSRWFNPDWVVDQYRVHGWLAKLEARGLSTAEAEMIVKGRVKTRRTLILGGRPEAATRHSRWAIQRDALAASDPALLGNGLYKYLAFLDWQQHREDWSREDYPPSANDENGPDPGSLAAMADRVRKGIAKVDRARQGRAAS